MPRFDLQSQISFNVDMFILSILLMFHIASLWSELHVIFHSVAWSYYLTVYPCSLCLLPLLFIFVFLCTISLFGRLYARLVGVSLQNFSWKKKKWTDHLVTWCDKKINKSHLLFLTFHLIFLWCSPICWTFLAIIVDLKYVLQFFQDLSF